MVDHRPEDASRLAKSTLTSNSSTASKDEGKSRNLSSVTPDSVAKEMAEAFQDLARGEQAATFIEANLTALERKLDAILAAYEADEASTTQDQESGLEKPMDDQQAAPKTNETSGRPNGKE